MGNRFRILSLVIILLALAAHTEQVAYAYGSPQEDWQFTSVTFSGCTNGAYRFATRVYNANVNDGYFFWQVVADQSSWSPTVRIWQAYASGIIRTSVPLPPGGVVRNSFIGNTVGNPYGGLQANQPWGQLPPGTDLFIQLSLVRGDGTRSIPQSVRVYKFHCDSAALPVEEYNCMGGTLGCGQQPPSSLKSALSVPTSGQYMPFPLSPPQ